VIYFCIARQHENPKGAVYLSLAVLVSFSITVFNLGWSYVMTFLPNLVGSDLYSTLITVLNSIPIRFSDVASFAVWVLITLAVFARPSHSRYVDDRALDNEPKRSP
jgi:hypothetical protein